MEGRVQPAKADSNDDPPISPHPPPPTSAPTQPASEAPEGPETYIVQIPRDQIYRVPPPENSRIFESYRKPPQQQQKRKCGCKCWFWTFILILILLAIVGIAVGIIHALFNPKPPKFSITKFHVNNSTSSHNKHADPSYGISLEIENPNEGMSVSYRDGGETMIYFNQKIIGQGNYPLTSQYAKQPTNVHLTLAGTKTAFPNDAEKGKKSTHTEMPVSLSLAINVPVKLKGTISFSKDLKVMCEFKVSTLATGTKISSQDCNSEF